MTTKRSLRPLTDNPDLKLISRKEAAELLGVHTETVKRYERRGKLAAVRLSDRNTRYTMTSIQKLIVDATV